MWVVCTHMRAVSIAQQFAVRGGGEGTVFTTVCCALLACYYLPIPALRRTAQSGTAQVP